MSFARKILKKNYKNQLTSITVLLKSNLIDTQKNIPQIRKVVEMSCFNTTFTCNFLEMILRDSF